MNITARMEYGLVALMDIALHQVSEGSVAVSEIAKRQGLTKNYLEQILSPLRTAGIINGQKGAGGGYRLSRPAKEILLSDVLTALDGGFLEASWKSGAPCEAAMLSALDQCLWQQLGQAVKSIAEQLTLACLMEHYDAAGSNGLMYYI